MMAVNHVGVVVDMDATSEFEIYVDENLEVWLKRGNGEDAEFTRAAPFVAGERSWQHSEPLGFARAQHGKWQCVAQYDSQCGIRNPQEDRGPLRWRAEPIFVDGLQGTRFLYQGETVEGWLVPGLVEGADPVRKEGLFIYTEGLGFLPVRDPIRNVMLLANTDADAQEMQEASNLLDRAKVKAAVQKSLEKWKVMKATEGSDIRTPYGYCEMNEAEMGRVMGAGVQLFFNSVKLYAVMFAVVFLLLLFNLISNVSGSFYENYPGDDDSSILRMSLGNIALESGNDTLVNVQVVPMHVLVFLFVLCFGTFMANWHRFKEEEHDAAHRTAGDYCLILKDLPVATTNEDIVRYFETEVLRSNGLPFSWQQDVCGGSPQYGILRDPATASQPEFTWAFPLRDVKSLLGAWEDYRRAKINHGQLKATAQLLDNALASERYGDFGKDKVVAMKATIGDKLSDSAAKHKEGKESFEEISQQQEATTCTGYGLVVFQFASIATLVEQKFKQPSHIQFCNFVKRYLLCGFCETNEPPPMVVAGKQHRIRAARAPEPDEIFWSNFHVTNRQRKLLIMRSMVAAFLALAASAGLIFAIESGKRDLNDDSTDEGRNSAISLVAALCTLVINVLLRMLCCWLNELEQHKTRTDQIIYLLYKLTAVYIVNNVLIYIVVLDHNKWFRSGGLAEAGTYLVITNMLCPPFFQLTDLGNRPFRWFKHWWKPPVTILEWQEAYMPEDFDLAEAYATMLKTITLGLYTCPLVPLNALLTMAALVLQYISWKYACLRYYRTPARFSHFIEIRARRIFWLILLGYPLMVLFTYDKDYYDLGNSPNSLDSAYPWFAAGILICCLLVYTILPVQGCTRALCCTNACFKGRGSLRDSAADNELGDGTDSKPFPAPVERKLLETTEIGQGTWSYIWPTPDSLKAGACFRATGSGGAYASAVTQASMMYMQPSTTWQPSTSWQPTQASYALPAAPAAYYAPTVYSGGYVHPSYDQAARPGSGYLAPAPAPPPSNGAEGLYSAPYSAPYSMASPIHSSGSMGSSTHPSGVVPPPPPPVSAVEPPPSTANRQSAYVTVESLQA